MSWNSVFEQLTCVLHDDPPSLPEYLRRPIQTSSSTTTLVSIDYHRNNANNFSLEFRDFVSQCLKKEVKSRPKYQALMNHPFYLRSITEIVDVGRYFQSVLDKVPADMNMNELCAISG
ncbi:unnamed protein product [Heterobilharzia americana]|nr:unnamed protein product [Heterobilharzia americana]